MRVGMRKAEQNGLKCFSFAQDISQSKTNKLNELKAKYQMHHIQTLKTKTRKVLGEAREKWPITYKTIQMTMGFLS